MMCTFLSSMPLAMMRWRHIDHGNIVPEGSNIVHVPTVEGK